MGGGMGRLVSSVRLMQARTIPGTKVPCSAPPLFNSRSVGLDGLVLPNGWVDQSILVQLIRTAPMYIELLGV